MRPLALALLLVAATAAPALGQERMAGGVPDSATRSALVALERQSWEAWKNRDTSFFRANMAENAIQNGRTGLAKKDEIVRSIASDCDVTSFALDESSLQVTMVDPNTALLTFKATQDATCGGTKAPSPVWATSMYVRRGGKWLNAFYQETAATP
jgi:hypothetical protein